MPLIEKINFKAVILGYLTALLIASLASLAVSLAFIIPQHTPDISPVELGQKVAKSYSFQFIVLLITFGSFMLGGYLAAKIATTNEIINALTVGVLAFTIVIVWYYFSQSTITPFTKILYSYMPMLASLLGGYISKRKKRLSPDKIVGPTKANKE
jgi:putative membrane protein (TIGR04086 family)